MLGQKPGTKACPLIAIANCLALERKITLPESVTLDAVCNCIASSLPNLSEADKIQIVEQLKEKYNGWELTITPEYEIPNDAAEMAIFKIFHIPVYVSPKDPCLRLTPNAKTEIVARMKAKQKSYATLMAWEHFYTICLHEDEIFALVTDEELHNNEAFYENPEVLHCL